MPQHAIPRTLCAGARFFLGALLVYAGFSKLQSGHEFAQTIANFRLLPAQGNQVLAVVLPWCELISGGLLLCGLWLRASALVGGVLFSAFAVAVLSALARGLDIACGCFGTASGSRVGLLALAIDAAALAAAVTVLATAPAEAE